MGKYFGTDGFRGEANVDLTAMHAFKVGRFLGWYYGRYHEVLKLPLEKIQEEAVICLSMPLVAGFDSNRSRCISSSCYNNT